MTKCGCEVPKKEIHQCSKCAESFCGRHIYYYIDEANISITRNSKPHCKQCYIEKYG